MDFIRMLIATLIDHKKDEPATMPRNGYLDGDRSAGKGSIFTVRIPNDVMAVNISPIVTVSTDELKS